MRYPVSIEKLMRLLNKLPGVGRRTSERYAFDLLLNWSQDQLSDLENVFHEMKKDISTCPTCGTLTDQSSCFFCSDASRRKDLLCVVSSPREVFAIEGTREFRGIYHVLGGLLSPLDGRGEEVLELSKLIARLTNTEVKEVILALDSTLEGDTTSLFLKQELENLTTSANLPLKVSRLAFGIPVGSTLEYVDGGTLAKAFSGRASF
jgi:recombination protein RecR